MAIEAGEVDPAGVEQAAQQTGADVEGLAEGQRFVGELASLGRSGEHLQHRQLLQGPDRIGVGMGP